jgi:hypothetical protein
MSTSPSTPAPAKSPTERALNESLSKSYLTLPPTTRFAHPVVAHGEYGMVAVIGKEGLYLQNDATGLWDGTADICDPEDILARANRQLAEATRGPPDRLTAVLWLPGGIGNSNKDICASKNPADLARTIENAMKRRLAVSDESLAPWIGAYASAALSSKPNPPHSMRRIVPLIESIISATVQESAIVCHGVTLQPRDLADPRYLLPALATAAFEDWGVVVMGGDKQPGHGKAKRSRGFSLKLEPDPNALLGYRVESLTPDAPYIALAPIVGALRRCRERHEFVVDDLTEQFARYLKKHDLDAIAVMDVDMRILAIGDDDE